MFNDEKIIIGVSTFVILLGGWLAVSKNFNRIKKEYL